MTRPIGIRASCWIAVVTSCLTILSVQMLHAQPTSQSLLLHPGWNAVFLEVQPAKAVGPAPSACDYLRSNDNDMLLFESRILPHPCEIFGEIPGISSVWAWNPRTSTVEFIQNPAQMVPKPSYMLSWFPGQPPVTNLHAITGETAYLIHRDESSSGDHTLTITGEPMIPRIKWVPNSFNFVGFHLDRSVTPPLFSSFFAGSSALDGQEMYVLRGNAWVKVQPSDRLAPGEAFWAYCKGSSEFTGPVALRLSRSEGFHLGARLEEESVGLLNVSAAAKDVSIRVSSAAPQLHWWRQDRQAGIAEWVDLSTGTPALDVSINAGETKDVLLGVKRAGLAAGVTYEANLEIRDGAGLLYVIPASVVGVGSEGLWVGDAVIRKVSQPGLPPESDPETPRPTGSEFSFRLIVHRDQSGRTRLLREVVQLWQPPGAGVTEGRYVLVANESRLAEFEGSALRDGRPVGRRISSTAFGFVGPREMSGELSAGGSLSVSISLPADDPTNPFLHLYHPDHRLPEQSFRVDRVITLQFSDRDGDGMLLPGVLSLGWSSNEVGGIYNETISFDKDGPEVGDEPYAVQIEGTFLLRRVSDIARIEY